MNTDDIIKISSGGMVYSKVKGNGQEISELLRSITEHTRLCAIQGATFCDSKYDSESVAFGYNMALDEVYEIVMKYFKKGTT